MKANSFLSKNRLTPLMIGQCPFNWTVGLLLVNKKRTLETDILMNHASYSTHTYQQPFVLFTYIIM